MLPSSDVVDLRYSVAVTPTGYLSPLHDHRVTDIVRVTCSATDARTSFFRPNCPRLRQRGRVSARRPAQPRIIRIVLGGDLKMSIWSSPLLRALSCSALEAGRAVGAWERQ